MRKWEKAMNQEERAARLSKIVATEVEQREVTVKQWLPVEVP